MPRVYQEMLGMAQAVAESALDWTIVRFIAHKDGKARGVTREGFFGTDKIGWGVTRADIAAFTPARINSNQYSQAASAISN